MTKALIKQKNQTKKIYYDNLIFITKSKNRKTNFKRKKCYLDFLNEIKKGEKTIEHAKASQEDFNNYIKTIRRGNKTKEQGNTLANVNRLFNGRNDVIKFVGDFGSMILEAKKKAAKEPTTGTGLKILTLKHLLQRLPIALAQVKPGNNSEGLLNEIRQIVYSLYQSKEITKKVYNNIIKSIKL